MEEYNVTSGKIGPKFGESGFSRSNTDVMVFIPEFYYRVIDDASGKNRYFYIADKKTGGFEKHPGSGRYVGRYNTGSGHVSLTGWSPLVNITRASARIGAKSKGSGWYEKGEGFGGREKRRGGGGGAAAPQDHNPNTRGGAQNKKRGERLRLGGRRKLQRQYSLCLY